MRTTHYFLLTVGLFFLTVYAGSSYAQKENKILQTKIEYSKLFIENVGQFPYMLKSNTNKEGILFAVDQGPTKIYFTKKGVTFNYIKAKAKPKKGLDAPKPTHDEWAESDNKEGNRRQYKQDEVSFIWDNANPDVEVIAEEAGSEYFSYSFRENNVMKDINFIRGYKRIIYKNLYPDIDVVYTFAEGEGIKYSLILHPGADISKFKMTYSVPVTLSGSGDVHIPTKFGDIIDHAPETYYTANAALSVNSKFTLTGNTVGFSLGNYDNMKSVTIDPWTVSPTFTTSTAAWEVETDASGNAYVIGGETPMELRKYDVTGAPVWTYVTPWDTSTVWLGTLATDNLGNSYITSGTTPQIKKITAAGGVAWSNNGPNGSCEYWSITFNCDKTKLIVGGTWVPFIISFDFSSAIYDIDITNGSILNVVTFDTVNISGFGVFPIEVRSISSSKNAKYIFLTHKNVGAINQNIGACPSDAPVFELDNGHNLSYKCENYLPESQNGGGLKALVANDQYFYTHSGNQIHRRSLSNGVLINSASIPGGVSATDIFGDLYVSNSGLAVDNCGNIYAGSTNGVVKYDASLNQLSTAPLTFCVYDVSVSTGGEVVAVGAQSDNSAVNRNGRIQSVNMTACGQYALVCCDANICPPDTVCSTDPAFNLVATTPGGIWSGTGITNASLGTFDPSVAGPGQHWVVYTLLCGSDSVLVNVNLCATLNVCQELNGTISVSGGTAPYTWEEWIPASTTNITTQAECLACSGSYTWFFGTCLDGIIPVTTCSTPAHWQTFATGTNITPTGNWPIRVTDSFGNTVTINSLVSLPFCSPCPMSASASPSTICSGQSTILTGTGATTYAWNPGGLSGTTVTVSPTTTTTYTVTGTLGACTATATVTVTVNTTPTVSASANPTTICSGGSTILTGSGAASYAWNPGSLSGTNVTVSPTSTTTYTVTGTSGGCTGTATVTVAVSSSITVSASASPSTICVGGSTDLTGTGATSYTWNPGGLSGTTVNVSPTTTTTYTVTGSSGGCTGTATVTVTVNSSITVSASASPSTICVGGSTDLTGTGATSYTWNPGGLSGTTVNVSPTTTTTYTVTGSSGGCTGTATVTVTVSSSLSVSATAAPPAVCIGSSTTLTGTGATSYTWNPGGLTGTTVNVSPTTTTTYSVTGTSGGCSGTGTIVITVNPLPNVSTTSTTATCNFSNGSATAIPSGGTSPYTYSWNTSPVQTGVTATGISGGNYIVTVTDANGCSGTAGVTVATTGGPTANVSPTSAMIILGDSIALNASGGITYQWTPTSGLSCTDCPNPYASPTSSTIYCVMVTDANLCSDTACVTINIDLLCGEVFVPNAFSPNDDQKNDRLYVRGNCITTMKFAIYDRWGEKVFESDDNLEYWDGKLRGKQCNSGVYVWYLTATLHDGTEISKKGNLTLFR